jgi:glycosyltransferase involved in cell wall biosynthesis
MAQPIGDLDIPLFSIVTVCRNAERSIAKSIESVAAQEGQFGTVEHIVIDGKSTDGTMRILERYPHLRVVSEPDAGIYDAMNKGVAMARGSYVAFLNADDWYQPDALATVAVAISAVPDARIIHGDIRRWVSGVPIDVVKPTLGRGFHGTLKMPVHHPATFAHRDVFTRVGTFDLAYRVFADYDWARRVVRAGTVLHYCPAVLTNFAMGGVSTTRVAAAELYCVFRANGASVFAAVLAVAYSCAVAFRSRLRMRM